MKAQHKTNKMIVTLENGSEDFNGIIPDTENITDSGTHPSIICYFKGSGSFPWRIETGHIHCSWHYKPNKTFFSNFRFHFYTLLPYPSKDNSTNNPNFTQQDYT
jgi:hypothetical protein